MRHSLRLAPFPPSALLQIAEDFASFDGTCLLYSGGNGDAAQHSFLALFPYDSIQVDGSTIVRKQASGESYTIETEDPWEALQNGFFAELQSEDSVEKAFGWFGYGMAATADRDRPLRYRPSPSPDAYWQRCALVIDVDHSTQEAVITRCADPAVLATLPTGASDWVESVSTAEGWHRYLQGGRPMDFEAHHTTTTSSRLFNGGNGRRESYLKGVQHVKQLIAEGEVYQLNLSQEFNFAPLADPFSLFCRVNQLNPAPFSSYLHAGETTIICSSPERFLCKRGPQLETRPIKGTIRRGTSVEEDERLRNKLLASPKERAELLMITDLMRNDLGKVSETGSVAVRDLFRCEAYTNVFHLLSVIQSKAAPHYSPLEIIRSTFPGGSITGCPKLRAIEAIDALEQRARGIYTGSIGYIAGNGDFDLNIAIRTIEMTRERTSIQLGSGIVYDSDPEEEYRETLHKGASLFALLGLSDDLQREMEGASDGG